MKRYVVLVHGFMRRGGNMRYLVKELRRLGYVALAPTLPAVFQNVRACSESLARYLEGRLPEKGIVHFVGHSMGGLIIRDCLSRHEIRGLGRVVLMGTPNKGSRHANRLLRFVPFLRHVFKALPDLAVGDEPSTRTAGGGTGLGIVIAPPLNVPPPEIGIVIGIRPDPIRKYMLRGENDGLVTSESVRGVEADDEIRLPYVHERLHWRPEAARAVSLFLETGKFKKELE